VRPEDGDRRGAGGAGELGVGREAVEAGDLAEQLGGHQGAAAAFGEQSRRERRDECGELVLEVVDRARELADVAQPIAGDPDARALLGGSDDC
jgi:hypothetical protein